VNTSLYSRDQPFCPKFNYIGGFSCFFLKKIRKSRKNPLYNQILDNRLEKYSSPLFKIQSYRGFLLLYREEKRKKQQKPPVLLEFFIIGPKNIQPIMKNSSIQGVFTAFSSFLEEKAGKPPV